MRMRRVLPQYDIAVISEGSDEIAMTAFTLNAIKADNVHGQTMRAFTAAEMAKVLKVILRTLHGFWRG